jgi:uncharacterized protein (UPF0332 family)
VPVIDVSDAFLRFVSTAPKSIIDGLPSGGRRNPFPLEAARKQVVADRFRLAADHLRAADHLLRDEQFRSAIGRYYYAMYHAARGTVFGSFGGDDYEKHSTLPKHLPLDLDPGKTMEEELNDARLLRNEADYDVYPTSAWRSDAISLSIQATSFVAQCSDFSTGEGLL